MSAQIKSDGQGGKYAVVEINGATYEVQLNSNNKHDSYCEVYVNNKPASWVGGENDDLRTQLIEKAEAAAEYE